jgi:hypothetical protein
MRVDAREVNEGRVHLHDARAQIRLGRVQRDADLIGAQPERVQHQLAFRLHVVEVAQAAGCALHHEHRRERIAVGRRRTAAGAQTPDHRERTFTSILLRGFAQQMLPGQDAVFPPGRLADVGNIDLDELTVRDVFEVGVGNQPSNWRIGGASRPRPSPTAAHHVRPVHRLLLERPWIVVRRDPDLSTGRQPQDHRVGQRSRADRSPDGHAARRPHGALDRLRSSSSAGSRNARHGRLTQSE